LNWCGNPARQKRPVRTALIACLLLALPAQASADALSLKSGELYFGKISHVREGLLLLELRYGFVWVPLSDVDRVAFDRPYGARVTVHPIEGEAYAGFFRGFETAPPGGFRISLSPEADATSVAWSAVREIIFLPD
jgi:hypothetical protein